MAMLLGLENSCWVWKTVIKYEKLLPSLENICQVWKIGIASRKQMLSLGNQSWVWETIYSFINGWRVKEIVDHSGKLFSSLINWIWRSSESSFFFLLRSPYFSNNMEYWVYLKSGCKHLLRLFSNPLYVENINLFFSNSCMYWLNLART